MKTLFPLDPKPQLVHKHKLGRRKGKRLLVKKRPTHLILKSRYILVTHRRWIEGRIQDYAHRFGIRIFQYAICGDHIHFAIQIQNADYYKKFIRSLTGVVAREMGKGIWRLLPFTRIASWGANFRNLIAYIQKNHDETTLGRKYEPRKRMKKNRAYTPEAAPAPNMRRAFF